MNPKPLKNCYWIYTKQWAAMKFAPFQLKTIPEMLHCIQWMSQFKLKIWSAFLLNIPIEGEFHSSPFFPRLRPHYVTFKTHHFFLKLTQLLTLKTLELTHHPQDFLPCTLAFLMQYLTLPNHHLSIYHTSAFLCYVLLQAYTCRFSLSLGFLINQNPPTLFFFINNLPSVQQIKCQFQILRTAWSRFCKMLLSVWNSFSVSLCSYNMLHHKACQDYQRHSNNLVLPCLRIFHCLLAHRDWPLVYRPCRVAECMLGLSLLT